MSCHERPPLGQDFASRAAAALIPAPVVPHLGQASRFDGARFREVIKRIQTVQVKGLKNSDTHAHHWSDVFFRLVSYLRVPVAKFDSNQPLKDVGRATEQS